VVVECQNNKGMKFDWFAALFWVCTSCKDRIGVEWKGIKWRGKEWNAIKKNGFFLEGIERNEKK